MTLLALSLALFWVSSILHTFGTPDTVTICSLPVVAFALLLLPHNWLLALGAGGVVLLLRRTEQRVARTQVAVPTRRRSNIPPVP